LDRTLRKPDDWHLGQMELTGIASIGEKSLLYVHPLKPFALKIQSHDWSHCPHNPNNRQSWDSKRIG
jgi:hypothetical protein